MLRQSETRSVADSEISGQSWPFCMNQVFGKISPWPPQKLCVWKMSLKNSALCWLLIGPVSTHGLIAMNFWSQDSVLDRLWTDWLCRCLVRFLGLKRGENCWGLHTRSEDHLLSFLAPTQTHVSDAHSHGYGHFGTATCGVSSLLEIRVIERVEVLAQLRTAIRLELSSLVIKLGWLGDLMQSELSLIVLTKTKDNNSLLWIVRTWWQNALNKRY
jgi:hypothetical protein